MVPVRDRREHDSGAVAALFASALSIVVGAAILRWGPSNLPYRAQDAAHFFGRGEPILPLTDLRIERRDRLWVLVQWAAIVPGALLARRLGGQPLGHSAKRWSRPLMWVALGVLAVATWLALSHASAENPDFSGFGRRGIAAFGFCTFVWVCSHWWSGSVGRVRPKTVTLEVAALGVLVYCTLLAIRYPELGRFGDSEAAIQYSDLLEAGRFRTLPGGDYSAHYSSLLGAPLTLAGQVGAVNVVRTIQFYISVIAIGLIVAMVGASVWSFGRRALPLAVFAMLPWAVLSTTGVSPVGSRPLLMLSALSRSAVFIIGYLALARVLRRPQPDPVDSALVGAIAMLMAAESIDRGVPTAAALVFVHLYWVRNSGAKVVGHAARVTVAALLVLAGMVGIGRSSSAGLGSLTSPWTIPLVFLRFGVGNADAPWSGMHVVFAATFVGSFVLGWTGLRLAGRRGGESPTKPRATYRVDVLLLYVGSAGLLSLPYAAGASTLVSVMVGFWAPIGCALFLVLVRLGVLHSGREMGSFARATTAILFAVALAAWSEVDVPTVALAKHRQMWSMSTRSPTDLDAQTQSLERAWQIVAPDRDDVGVMARWGSVLAWNGGLRNISIFPEPYIGGLGPFWRARTCEAISRSRIRWLLTNEPLRVGRLLRSVECEADSVARNGRRFPSGWWAFDLQDWSGARRSRG